MFSTKIKTVRHSTAQGARILPLIDKQFILYIVDVNTLPSIKSILVCLNKRENYEKRNYFSRW